jgi:hypothetical protein
LQEAQQSAESQHDAVAAFSAPAKPSAITAINTNACSFFMDFSPFEKSNVVVLLADSNAISGNREKHCGQISRRVAAVLRGVCLCRCAWEARQVPLHGESEPSLN